MQKNYYAIIPANVRYDKRLNANAKLLYGEITALCNQYGFCWATNSYFSKLYDVSKVTISRWINQLIDGGYVVSSSKNIDGVDRRILSINSVPLNKNDKGGYQKCYAPLNKNDNTPLNKNDKHNNTDINITSNINNNIVRNRTKYNYEHEHMVLAKLLLKEIRKNNPNHKEPNLNSWANTIRLMMERDNRSFDDIKKVILFCQNDSFWYKNILSAGKLRKQFDRLYLQMKDSRGVNDAGIRNGIGKDNKNAEYDFSKKGNMSWLQDGG